MLGRIIIFGVFITIALYAEKSDSSFIDTFDPNATYGPKKTNKVVQNPATQPAKTTAPPVQQTTSKPVQHDDTEGVLVFKPDATFTGSGASTLGCYYPQAATHNISHVTAIEISNSGRAIASLSIFNGPFTKIFVTNVTALGDLNAKSPYLSLTLPGNTFKSSDVFGCLIEYLGTDQTLHKNYVSFKVSDGYGVDFKINRLENGIYDLISNVLLLKKDLTDETELTSTNYQSLQRQVSNNKVVTDYTLGAIADRLDDLRQDYNKTKEQLNTDEETVTQELAAIKMQVQNLEDENGQLKSELASVINRVAALEQCACPTRAPTTTPKKVLAVCDNQPANTGRKIIQSSAGFDVLCDTDEDGGGWTVLQSRKDGTVSFDRPWAAYKKGFGSFSSEFWLGLEKLRAIMKLQKTSYELRVTIVDYHNSKAYAKYSNFEVAGEVDKYRLSLSGYTGDAGDAFTSKSGNDLDGAQFTTVDRDNDKNIQKNCAVEEAGGFWYNSCTEGSVNGKWGSYLGDGARWEAFSGKTPLAFVEMKFRKASTS